MNEKDRKQHIENEVEKTLHALDDLQRAKTDDFFFSRVQARMEKKSPGFNYGLSLAAAAVLLFIFVNITVVYQYAGGNWFQANDYSEEVYLEAFAEDYETGQLTYNYLFSEE